MFGGGSVINHLSGGGGGGGHSKIKGLLKVNMALASVLVHCL